MGTTRNLTVNASSAWRSRAYASWQLRQRDNAGPECRWTRGKLMLEFLYDPRLFKSAELFRVAGICSREPPIRRASFYPSVYPIDSDLSDGLGEIFRLVCLVPDICSSAEWIIAFYFFRETAAQIFAESSFGYHTDFRLPLSDR